MLLAWKRWKNYLNIALSGGDLAGCWRNREEGHARLNILNFEYFEYILNIFYFKYFEFWILNIALSGGDLAGCWRNREGHARLNILPGQARSTLRWIHISMIWWYDDMMIWWYHDIMIWWWWYDMIMIWWWGWRNSLLGIFNTIGRFLPLVWRKSENQDGWILNVTTKMESIEKSNHRNCSKNFKL